MESPIWNLFANIVMGDLETKCLSVLKKMYNCIQKKYDRYVDATFLITDKTENDLVIHIFNNYDVNLKFTHEIEENNSIVSVF